MQPSVAAKSHELKPADACSGDTVRLLAMKVFPKRLNWRSATIRTSRGSTRSTAVRLVEVPDLRRASLRQMLSYVVFSCCISSGGPHGSRSSAGRVSRRKRCPLLRAPRRSRLPTNSVLATGTSVPDGPLRRNRSNANDVRGGVSDLSVRCGLTGVPRSATSLGVTCLTTSRPFPPCPMGRRRRLDRNEPPGTNVVAKAGRPERRVREF